MPFVRTKLTEDSTLRDLLSEASDLGKRVPGPIHLEFTVGKHRFLVELKLLAIDGNPVRGHRVPSNESGKPS